MTYVKDTDESRLAERSFGYDFRTMQNMIFDVKSMERLNELELERGREAPPNRPGEEFHPAWNSHVVSGDAIMKSQVNKDNKTKLTWVARGLHKTMEKMA